MKTTSACILQGWEKVKPEGAHLAKVHLARKTR
jgi:hypothetical protein